MAKVPLPDIGSLGNPTSAQNAINNRLDAIEMAFDNTVSRDGQTPNQMESDFDMNGFGLMNVKDPVDEADAVNLRSVGPLVNAFAAQIAQVIIEATLRVDVFTATASQTQFALTDSPGTVNNVVVMDNGDVLIPGIDYTLSGSDLKTLEFFVGRTAGHKIVARYSQLAPTDSLLRSDLLNTISTKGSSLIALYDVYDQTYSKTLQDLANIGAVNVMRFIPPAQRAAIVSGSTTYDCTNDIKRAITYVSENATRRGATLLFPRGRYIITDTLDLTSYATDNAINISMVGEGFMSTWLDFSSMAGTKDCIRVANDQQVRIEGFYIKGGSGTRDGIHFGRNLADGGAEANAVSMFLIRDCRIQAQGRDGVHHYNSYMGTMERVYCLANGRDGFRMEGYHTTLTFKSCYARANTAGAGFRVNGMIGSHFIGCASDVNAFGFVGSNIHTTIYSGCDAEGNNQDGWFMFSDNTGAPTSNPLFVSECYDVRGVELVSCSGYGNNIGNAGYAGLLRAASTGTHSGAGTFNDSSPHRTHVTVRSCDANVAVAGTKAIVTSTSGGGDTDVVLDGDNYFPGGFTKGASTRIRNRALRGKKVTLHRQTTDLTVANTTTTAITWLQADDEIGGCWSGGAPTLLTIPATAQFSRVRFIGATGWVGNAAGSRRFIVQDNAAGVLRGLPRDDRAAAGTWNSTATAGGDIIDVTPSQQFKMEVEQSSGGNLDLRSNTTFLTMEIIE